MPFPSEEVLYASGEILYECRAGIAWFWELPSSRRFSWVAGVLSVKIGDRWQALSRQPTWEAGIQFSCGFEAGRCLLPLGSEGEV